MDHSVTARYAGRPAAFFVRRRARAHDPRLGLRPAGSFRSAAGPLTVLRDGVGSPVARLHEGRRSLRIVGPRLSGSGVPRPATLMRWSRIGRRTPNPGSSAASAPWLA
jgi:hypothetical protein